MAIFDPNLKYLSKLIRNPSKPGLLIKLNKDRAKLNRHKDQLKPYNGIFGIGDIVDINNNEKTIDYDGTIFRLPFRKTISGLSSVLYCQERAKSILKILFENAENLLMYTQNICKLELYTLSENAEHMDLFFSIEKSGIQFIQKYNYEFKISTFCNNENRELIRQSNILRLVGELIQSNSKSVEKTSIFIQKIKIALLKSRIFPELKENYSNSYWFQIVSCFSRPIELSNNQSEKMLPCTAISFKVIPNEVQTPIRFTLDKTFNNGSVFCFLPLPSRTELNFNVSANFFLTSTREDIIYSSKDRIGAFESSWNDHLQACLAITLINCCEAMANAIDYDMNDLMNLWPIKTKFLKFEKDFYNQIFDYNKKKYSIFKHEQRSYSIEKCKILNLTFNEKMSDLAKIALQEIFGKEYFVMKLPEKLSKYLDDKKIILKNKINDYEFCQKFTENINKMPLNRAVEMINYLLKEYVCEKNGAFTKIGLFLKDKPFLPTNLNATYRKANELISKNSSLIDLYDPKIDDVFPNNELFRYNERILIKLGLIHEYLPSDMILERVKTLTKNSNLKYDSWVLMNHFIITLTKETQSTNVQSKVEILKIKFLKAKIKRKLNKELIWYSDIHHEKLWSLNELYSDLNEQLIFRVCPLFDSSKLKTTNSIMLLNLKPDNYDNYIQQSVELHRDWCNNNKNNNNNAGIELYKCNLRFLEWLNNNFNSLSSSCLPENILFFNLTNKYEYLSIQNVAFEVRYPAFPYLIELPRQFYQYSNVLKKLGVQQKFNSNYLIGKLNEIYSKFNNIPIDISTAELCINIVKELDLVCDLKTVRQLVFLPDKDLFLRKSTDLCFQDESNSWLKSTKHKVVHDKIPVDIAKKLEIIKLQTHLIKSLMQGFSFGQKEPLVARIRKLLESYPNFFDIFKELIQNADDCGASEISFILDTRKHGCEKLFSKEFSALQGPAILCYNDKIFTENDLNALKTLGVGNKAENKCKIGKYGVGFNCVYRLTDAPQIMSNLDNWVIFDPLCQHFPDLIDLNPGYRIPFDINDSDSPFNQYEDVINSFRGEFKDVNKLKNGTMFRFALRKVASSIHDKVFTPVEVENELKKRSSDLKNCMIFLKNLRQLKFVKINSDGSKETIFEFMKEFPTEKDEIEHSNFIKYLSNAAPLSYTKIIKNNFHYDLKISDLMQNDDVVFHIINQIGFENKGIYLNDSSNFFPFGAIAIPVGKEPSKVNGSLYCFLPLPIPSPMPYHINGYFALANESRQTLFKMSDVENDKFKWNKHLFNDIISNLILEGLIYIRSYVELKFIQEPQLIEKNYLKYFPALETNKRFVDSIVYIKEIEKCFYENFYKTQANLIPIYKISDPPQIEWININNPVLASSENLFQWSTIITNQFSTNVKFYTRLCRILIKYGFKICTFLQLVQKLNDFHKKIFVKDSKIIIKKLNGTDILNFYKSYNNDLGLNIQQTNFLNTKNLIKLIEFCLYEIKINHIYTVYVHSNNYNELNGCSLLLDASEKLRKFSLSEPLFKEDYFSIFLDCKEKFIHPCFYFLNESFTKKVSIRDLSSLLPFAIDKTKYYIQMSSEFNFESFPEANDEIVKILLTLWKIIENASISAKVYGKVKAKDYLSTLSMWTLIPVKFKNNKKIYLAPISSLNMILIDESYHFGKSPLETLFGSLNLPFIANSEIWLLAQICVNLNDLNDLLKFFNYICNKNIDLIKMLNSNECYEILKYFVDKLDSPIKNKNLFEEQKLQIMSLKLFENAFGEIISVNNKTAIIINRRIPLNGLKQIFPINAYYLAYERNDGENIYRTLSMKTYDVQEFYETYLPNLNANLNFQDKNTHLVLINDSKNYLSQALIKKLKSFNFIKTSEGEILSANRFFNPEVKFFKIIYRNDSNKFPTQPYDTDAWMPFLRLIGLKGITILNNEASINEYLELAINSFDHDNLDDSLFLFIELYSILINFDKNQKLAIIGAIKNSIEFLTDAINTRKLKDINVVKPIFDQIYMILKNIFVTIGHTKVFQFFESIKKLNLILHEYEVDDRRIIKLSPIEWFVEKNLRKYDEIEGHLYIYPDYLFVYKEMFLHLGLNCELTYEICVKVLSKLKIDKAFDESKALKAMNLLFKCKAPEFLIDETLELYLLNGNLKLVKAHDLYYIDKEDLNHLYKTEFCKNCCIISLETFAVHFGKYKFYKWEKIIKNLLKQDQPKAISGNIKKEIIDDYEIKNEEDVNLNNKVKHDLFIRTVKLLLNEKSNEIDDFFMNIKCYKTSQLKTKVYFNGQLIPDSDLNEKTWTKIDDSSKSITFYRSIRSPYITNKNLCEGIVNGLEKFYFKNDGWIKKSVKDTIIDILLEKSEDEYELLLDEYTKFE